MFVPTEREEMTRFASGYLVAGSWGVMVRGGRLEYQKLDQLARASLKVLWLAGSVPEGPTELPQYDYRYVGRRRTIVEVGRMVLDNGNPWYLGLVRFLPSTFS